MDSASWVSWACHHLYIAGIGKHKTGHNRGQSHAAHWQYRQSIVKFDEKMSTEPGPVPGLSFIFTMSLVFNGLNYRRNHV